MNGWQRLGTRKCGRNGCFWVAGDTDYGDGGIVKEKPADPIATMELSEAQVEPGNVSSSVLPPEA